jgi:hypothetical protein
VSLPEPTFSASIEGKKTNRVKQVKRQAKRGRPPKANKVRRATPQNPDGEYIIISVSAYPSDLHEMDALADRVQMSRSALIRKAIKHFKEHIEHGNQAQMWKAALR